MRTLRFLEILHTYKHFQDRDDLGSLAANTAMNTIAEYMQMDITPLALSVQDAAVLEEAAKDLSPLLTESDNNVIKAQAIKALLDSGEDDLRIFANMMNIAITEALDRGISPNLIALRLSRDIQELMKMAAENEDDDQDDDQDEDDDEDDDEECGCDECQSQYEDNEDGVPIVTCNCKCPAWNTPNIKTEEYECICGNIETVCATCLSDKRITMCRECKSRLDRTGGGIN